MAQDYVEIVMLGTSAADPTREKNIANVFQYRRTSAVATPSKSSIASSWQADIGVNVLALLNEDYVQVGVTVRFFDDALDAPILFPFTPTGGVTGQRCPNYVTATIRLKSNIRSRSGRGRKSFSPLAESSTTGDSLSTAGQTLADALAAAMLSGFNDAGLNPWRPIVKSSMPPAQYLVNPVVLNVNDVVSCTANPNLGSLLRRKVKA